MATRIVAGVQFDDKPRGQRVFISPSTRWKVIVDGIRAVDECLAANEYRLHMVLMDALIMAEVGRRNCKADRSGVAEQLSFQVVEGCGARDSHS